MAHYDDMHSKHYSEDYKDIFLALGILTAAILALGATTAYADTNDQDWENRDEARNIDVQLSGSKEVPSVNTDTTGRYWLDFDKDGSDMTSRLDVYDGDEITAAHLHCAEPGENGPPVVTLFEDSNGTDVDGQLVSGSIDDTDIDDANCQSEIGYDIDNVQDLARVINDGKIYVNVHSQARPEGLIRADLPEGQRNDDNGHGGWNGSDDHGWDSNDHGWKDDDRDGKNDWYKDHDGSWKDSCNDWSDDNHDGRHDWNNKEWDRWEKDRSGSWDNNSHSWNDSKDDHHDYDWKDSDHQKNNNHDWDNQNDHEWKHGKNDWNSNENDGRDGKDGNDGHDGYSNNRKDDGNRWGGNDSHTSDRILSDISARLGVRLGR
ncbi:CHRD domain-containing protein [bacterium]|nr:CHRD domain-containing protein [bacterium]